MIPKKIHYVWFGNKPKPDIVLKCIASWKKYMPDYDIIEWNETNFLIDNCQFAKEAHEYGKWAFVSDYARFKVLLEHGGIYFDTDVELLKPIPQEILAQSSFTGVEFSGKVSPGLVYAAAPNDAIVQYMVNYYEHTHFVPTALITVNEIITDYLLQYGFKEKADVQIIAGLAIYPDSYFCGYDQDVKEIKVSPETISIHHYSGTWKKTTIKKRLQIFLKNIVGVEVYRQLLHAKRKLKNVLFRLLKR